MGGSKAASSINEQDGSTHSPGKFVCLLRSVYAKVLFDFLHPFPNDTEPEPWIAITANRTCTPMDGRHFRCRAKLRSSSRPGMVLMMSVGGLGLARGGTGANSRVRAPMVGPSSPSAELQRRAGPSAAVKLSWAESVLLWAVMEMRGGAWLPVGMGGGAFLKLKAADRVAESQSSIIPTQPHPRGTQDPLAKDHSSRLILPRERSNGRNWRVRGRQRTYSQEPGLPETEAGAARRGRQSSS